MHTKDMKPGTVYWITGLAGSGKTTIARLLHDRLKKINPKTILLDGDKLRGIFGAKKGHSLEERRELAICYSRLCNMLSRHGLDVICATMSLFKEIHDFNRKHIVNYREIFIECDMKELIRRDKKGIYSKALNDKTKDVVGINLPYDIPKKYDLVIGNTALDRLNEKVETILALTSWSKPSGEKDKENWDYSLQAKYYKFRPSYCEQAIDVLVKWVGARKDKSYTVADIGAGTGNLAIMLLKRGFDVIAVEPNDEMASIGKKETSQFKNIKWIKATGISTALKKESVNWAAFGSSFNVMDRNTALKEAHRILRKKGFFTCIWNHRDLEDPIQKKVEDEIIKLIPAYDRGARREDQRFIIEQNKNLFENIFYTEVDFNISITRENYINAWKSVRNKYWDLSAKNGRELFKKIARFIRENIPEEFDVKYTTRAWTAQKKG